MFSFLHDRIYFLFRTTAQISPLNSHAILAIRHKVKTGFLDIGSENAINVKFLSQPTLKGLANIHQRRTELLRVNNTFSFAAANRMYEWVLFEISVYQGGDDAEFGQPEPHGDICGGIAHEECNNVAFAVSSGLEGVGHLIGELIHLETKCE